MTDDQHWFWQRVVMGVGVAVLAVSILYGVWRSLTG
jgi:hypothetical protein